MEEVVDWCDCESVQSDVANALCTDMQLLALPDGGDPLLSINDLVKPHQKLKFLPSRAMIGNEAKPWFLKNVKSDDHENTVDPLSAGLDC